MNAKAFRKMVIGEEIFTVSQSISPPKKKLIAKEKIYVYIKQI